jgi:hypothetical protein
LATEPDKSVSGETFWYDCLFAPWGVRESKNAPGCLWIGVPSHLLAITARPRGKLLAPGRSVIYGYSVANSSKPYCGVVKGDVRGLNECDPLLAHKAIRGWPWRSARASTLSRKGFTGWIGLR